MYEPLLELLAEVAPTVGYALGTVLLTGFGVVVEKAGIEHLSAGDVALGVWLGVMGLALLYGGVYLMGYEGLVKRASG